MISGLASDFAILADSLLSAGAAGVALMQLRRFGVSYRFAFDP
jgi:hypothetical protein